MTGEIREGYGRDENNLSRAETSFYKGDSNDDGRDGDNSVCFSQYLYLKLEPPTNSRMMEVGGISLSLTGRKKRRNFSRR